MSQKKQPQGLLPFDIELLPDSESLTGRAGLPLVLETSRALGLHSLVQKHLSLRERNSGFPEAQKVEALLLLLAAGGDVVDDIEILRRDVALCRLLGQDFPGADALLN